MTAILALSAAAIYGTADFLGGVAARRTSALAVTVLTHVVGLTLLVGALLVLPAAHPTPDRPGLRRRRRRPRAASALILFYRAMATGSMSVVAPVAALFGAALPGHGRRGHG